jgi:Flp pilus assembly pilin Flp
MIPRPQDIDTPNSPAASLCADTRGLSTVEYVILLVLVAVLGIGVWRSLGGTLRAQVSEANGQLQGLQKESQSSE